MQTELELLLLLHQQQKQKKQKLFRITFKPRFVKVQMKQ